MARCYNNGEISTSEQCQHLRNLVLLVPRQVGMWFQVELLKKLLILATMPELYILVGASLVGVTWWRFAWGSTNDCIPFLTVQYGSHIRIARSRACLNYYVAMECTIQPRFGNLRRGVNVESLRHEEHIPFAHLLRSLSWFALLPWVSCTYVSLRIKSDLSPRE